MATTLILVRHGQTAWNKEERFRGRTDLPLNDTGLRQAAAVARRIVATYRPAAVLTSPLQRAARTAQAIAQPLGLTPQVHSGLLDLDYGELAGLSLAEAEARFSTLYRAWANIPHMVRFPGGESLSDVFARASNLVRELAETYPHDQVALVSHVVVCRVLMGVLLEVPASHFWRFRVDTASLSVFEFEQGRATLIMANDTCHLHNLPNV